MTACPLFNYMFLRLFEDLANQIRHSVTYQNACRAAKVSLGQYLALPAAEWFSGLPTNWTSLESKVCKKTFEQMFPHALSKALWAVCHCFVPSRKCLWQRSLLQAGKAPCISLFSGCGALELGLSRPAAQEFCSVLAAGDIALNECLEGFGLVCGASFGCQLPATS